MEAKGIVLSQRGTGDGASEGSGSAEAEQHKSTGRRTGIASGVHCGTSLQQLGMVLEFAASVYAITKGDFQLFKLFDTFEVSLLQTGLSAAKAVNNKLNELINDVSAEYTLALHKILR